MSSDVVIGEFAVSADLMGSDPVVASDYGCIAVGLMSWVTLPYDCVGTSKVSGSVSTECKEEPHVESSCIGVICFDGRADTEGGTGMTSVPVLKGWCEPFNMCASIDGDTELSLRDGSPSV